MKPELNIISKDDLKDQNENENIIKYFLPLLKQHNIEIKKGYGVLSIFETDINLITIEDKIINYKIDIYDSTNLLFVTYNNKLIKITGETYFKQVHSQHDFYKLILEAVLKAA